VNPEALSLAGHDQPIALTQFKRDCLLRSPMTKLKAPRRTKRQVGDCRVIPKTRLVVAMPADTVAAISIEIEQNGIVQSAQKLLRPVRAGVEQLPETAWLGGGYRCTCSQHRRTRRPPRNRHIPAEQACGFDPPWDAFGKTCRNIWPRDCIGSSRDQRARPHRRSAPCHLSRSCN
jgi:hypothetical protein